MIVQERSVANSLSSEQDVAHHKWMRRCGKAEDDDIFAPYRFATVVDVNIRLTDSFCKHIAMIICDCILDLKMYLTIVSRIAAKLVCTSSADA